MSAVLTLGLAGCQTRAQQQNSQTEAVFKAANDSRLACSAQVERDPTLEPFLRRVGRPPSPFARSALERIGDLDKISEPETRMVKEFFDIMSRCEEAFAAAITPASPEHALLVRRALNERLQNALRLTRRAITWGEYNQGSDAIRAQVSERARQIGAARQQQMQAMHNTEMEERRQAAMIMQQQQQQQMQRQQQQEMQQQLINSMNRPVTTNCNRFGSTVNCMSY